MEDRLLIANYRSLCMYIALPIVAAACTPPEPPPVVHPAIEFPTPNSLMAQPRPPMDSLICPTIPSTDVVIPPAPYDEAVGDCALVGHSADIEVWLTQLEQIAENCHANRQANWAATNEARDDLDLQIDGLAVGPEKITSCPTYGSVESSEPIPGLPPSTHYYTLWLRTIGENVEEYCAMVDELIKPLWLACDEINFYQGCQATNPDQYHAIVDAKMSAAQINYDYTDFFYTNTLQVSGWGNFRLYYNEASIDCPRAEPATSTATFTFSKNAFCRKGPSVAYEDVAAFPQHQSVQIDGRNQDEPRWWWVLIPGTSAHCWVSDSTGSAAGPFEGASIVAPPPLPTPTPTPTPRPRR